MMNIEYNALSRSIAEFYTLNFRLISYSKKQNKTYLAQLHLGNRKGLLFSSLSQESIDYFDPQMLLLHQRSKDILFS